MFAKAVFPTVQTKFSALGTNVVSSYELHCLLTLAQSTAIFQISASNGPPSILEIFDWSDIYPPSISANPDVPLLLVKELSEFGDSTVLSNSSSGTWTIDSTYARYSTTGDLPTFTIANASTTWVEILATSLHAQDLTSTNERFVIGTANGYFRSVSSVVTSGANYRFYLNGAPLNTVPQAGSQLTVYRDDMARGTSYYSQILDPLNYDAESTAPNTGTINAYAATYKQKNPVPYEGMFRAVAVPDFQINTGASTFALDGGAPYPILGMASAPLQGGEMRGVCCLRFNNTAWVLVESGGPLQIPAAQKSLQTPQAGQVQNGSFTTAYDAGAVNAVVANFTPAFTALPAAGAPFWVYIEHTNTGASTLNVNGTGAYEILGAAHTALQGSEMQAGGWAQFVYLGGAYYILIDCSGSPHQVSYAIQSYHALNLGQGDGRYAALNGNPNVGFGAAFIATDTIQALPGQTLILESDTYTASVSRADNQYIQHLCAPAINGQAAVILEQMNAPLIAWNQAYATNTTVTVTVSFTAPGPGVLLAISSRNNSSQAGQGNTSNLYINGVLATSDQTLLTISNMATSYTAGGYCSATIIAAANIAFSAHIALVYIPNI